MAVRGVLKPRPTSLNHLRPPLPTLLLFALFAFELRKMCGCFWNARSDWTVNSVAMLTVELWRWLGRKYDYLVVPDCAQNFGQIRRVRTTSSWQIGLGKESDALLPCQLGSRLIRHGRL